MADQTPAADPAKQDPVANKGTDPGKTDSSQFDVTKLSDEDFNKIYEDKRLFTHPRFKSLTEKGQKADELQAQMDKATKQRLEEEGKWKERAELAEKEAQDAKTTAEVSIIRNALATEAMKQGAVDTDAVYALADKSDLKIDKDGSIKGLDNLITKLLEAKPYLKGTTPKPVGSPSNPSPGQTEAGTKRFKLSQVQDHNFWKANEKDILEAFKLGLVDDDVYKPGVPTQ